MSSRSTFGTIKRIVAILIAIAIVLAAGIIVGQAPAIFGVEEEPTASISFEDQQSNGTVVTIDEVNLSDGGFVVVSDGDEPVVVSEYLEPGDHENVTIESEEVDLIGQLTATVHQDTTADEEYTYEETDGEEDRPYLEDGYPVSDTATVTPTDLEDPLEESFAVDSLEVPATATTNETIEIVAEISNPTEFDSQQHVELRLDGTVVEHRVLDLDAGESTDVSFEFDTAGTAPGERTLGVYTDADGLLEEVEFEFHTDPSIDVREASDDELAVDVATPEDGFVAVVDDGNVTDDDGLDVDLEDVVGTSDELAPGDHENVTIPFDENATVDEDDELSAILYSGDPDDLEAASAIEHDGEPVVSTFTIGDDFEADEPDDDADDDQDDADDDTNDGDDE